VRRALVADDQVLEAVDGQVEPAQPEPGQEVAELVLEEARRRGEDDEPEGDAGRQGSPRGDDEEEEGAEEAQPRAVAARTPEDREAEAAERLRQRPEQEQGDQEGGPEEDRRARGRRAQSPLPLAFWAAPPRLAAIEGMSSMMWIP
jgi:hypothetical protein